MSEPTPFVNDDGGRTAAGYKGSAGDCGCRAVAIATQTDYQEVYALINECSKGERKGKRKRGISSARNGVYRPCMKKVMARLGWNWKATMGIGTGCTVHLTPSELPRGRLVISLSKHYTAVIDGVCHDTHDPSREGTRCVYGYWYKEGDN